MASIPLKPEYGPTLGRLLAPHWRAASRGVRGVVIAAGVALVALLVGAGLTLENAKYSHGGRVPFSFSYRDMFRTRAPAGEYVKVESRANGHLNNSFAVGPLTLGPYVGSLEAALAVYADSYIGAQRLRYRDFVLRGEGKTKVNTVPAYDILYTARIEGHTVFGRDVLLLPERPHPRAGVFIVMHSSPATNAQVTAPLNVGTVGVLELPVETFNIG